MNNTTLQSLNDANFYATIEASHGVSIVFFSGASCHSCRHWKILLSQLVAKRPALQVFEIDAQQSMGLTQEYDVFHLPALFVFVNGHYHAPLECEARLETIEQTLDQVLAAPAQEAP
jgi:thioredoxin 1